jgi:ribonuclease PH
MRPDGRQPDELRPLSFERDFTTQADGSVLVTAGRTMVLCTATIDDDVPRWMRGRGSGWVTAEYSMLPGSSGERIRREVSKGSPSGRTHEIQRLIGRSLRAVCDMVLLGERQVIVDCDVLQADGGTRTASINGAYVALLDALHARKDLFTNPAGIVRGSVAAVSVGLLDDNELLDLDYEEDKDADVDLNLVMTGAGQFIEVQGTGEEATFSRSQLERLLKLGKVGIDAITVLQKKSLGANWPLD